MRFPTIDKFSIQDMIIRVIEDDILAFRINDHTIKLMEGDFDGDTLPMTFSPEQMQRDSENPDMPHLSFLPDPEHFETPEFTLTSIKAFPWPTSVMTGVGLTAKYLQGIITNLFKRIGIAADAMYKEEK
jgi:hypothetical protein